jgi:hypothetical protein
MALKNGTINPLNVLGFRILNRIPKHFSSVAVDIRQEDSQNLRRWIYNNLNSRFAVVNELMVVNGNSMTESTKIGFEDPREVTMFMLTCPYLEKK